MIFIQNIHEHSVNFKYIRYCSYDVFYVSASFEAGTGAMSKGTLGAEIQWLLQLAGTAAVIETIFHCLSDARSKKQNGLKWPLKYRQKNRA